MAVLSLVQTLPAHIIKEIALRASATLYRHEYHHRDCQRVCTQELFRLACVCGAWWQLLRPLIYRTVVLGLSSADKHLYRGGPRTLRQAIAAGCRRHVRQVNIHAAAITPRHSWADQSAGSAKLLGRCGELPRVRNVLFNIEIKFSPDTESAVRRAIASGLVQSAANSFAAIVDAAFRTMPNTRLVRVNASLSMSRSLESRPDVLRPFFDVRGIFGARVMHCSLNRDAAGLASPEPPLAGSLRSIFVSSSSDLGPAITLIRRNSETLERLSVQKVGRAAAVRLFFSDSDSGRPIVYPRLVYLDIAGTDTPLHEPWQQGASPFPALEVLLNWWQLPFPLAAIPLGTRARLRSLETYRLPDLRDLLRANAAAGGGGFPSLERIVLVMYSDRQLSAGEKVAWLSDLFGLSPNARTVSIENRHNARLSNHYGTVCFPPSLQHLSVTEPLTVGQIMSVIGACPQLRTAEFTLADYPGNSSKNAPTMAVIRQHREQHRVHSSGVWRLVVNAGRFQYLRRFFQFTVLLADLLPSITCVAVICHGLSPKCCRASIRLARERSVYRDSAHLHNVEFAL